MTEVARKAQTPADAGSTQGEVLPRRFGKYTLIRRLATGGMAELYLAIHRSIAGIERLLVIKRILPEFGRDRGYIEMLLKEARIALTFAHPNIVTVFDVGQVDGEYFLAMEHIHGEDLRSVVRAMKPKGVTEFPLEHALSIAIGTAAGLAYAHEKRDLQGNALRVVHRDVSPQNVVVSFTGDVKVVDFGIAKASIARDVRPSDRPSTTRSLPPSGDRDGASGEVRRAERDTNVSMNSGDGTGPGKVKGKIPYMSPEQARGDDLDHRSDVFSLGIILFELCTGRRLFRTGSDTETLKMITEGKYPRPSEANPRVSEGLEAVILKALAPDREARYQSARDLQSDLEAVARAERIPVSTLSLGEWMRMLFAERLVEQDAVLAESKLRADEIRGDAADDDEDEGSGRPSRAASQTPPSRRGALPLVAIVAAVGLAAAGLVAWSHRRDAAERTRVAAAAALRSGVIAVRSTPDGAQIWLDDAPTAFRTPHELTGLATGPGARHRVRLTAEGYEPYDAEVPLASARARAEVPATLVRARAHAFSVLEVTTAPPGARVMVDGREVQGATPLTVPELQASVEHTVLVRSPDHLDETFTFVGPAGAVESRAITLRERPLAPDEAWVTLVVDPPTAHLRVGEREYDTGSPYRVRVPAGRQLTITATAPGRDPDTRLVTAAAGRTLMVHSIRLAEHARTERPERPAAPVVPAAPVDARPGQVRVGANPWCNVTVDGAAHGQTPTPDIALAPGTHTIVCTNPERGAQRRTVTLAAGQRLGVRIDFPQP